MTITARDENGRQVSLFDADAFEVICSRVEDGEFTAPILRELGIKSATFYDWLKEPERATRYGIAKDAGEELLIARTLEIADDARNDFMEKHDKDGNCVGYVVNGEVVARSKLRVDTMLKVVAKFNPKRWGDKVEHSGKLVVSNEEFLAGLE